MGRPLAEIVENKALLEHRIANTNQGVIVHDTNRIEIWSIEDVKFIIETDNSITLQYYEEKLTCRKTLPKRKLIKIKYS